MSYSTIHPVFIDLQKKLYTNRQPIELKRLSSTRWTVQYRACDAVERTFAAIIIVLNNVAMKKDRQANAEAKGLLLQIDKKFLLHLVIYKNILSTTTSLSNYLQNPSLDYVKAQVLIEETKRIFEEWRRNDKTWKEIWEKTDRLAKEVGIDEMDNLKKINKRMRKIPEKLKSFIVESNVEDDLSAQEIITAKISWFYPILDKILLEFDRRFTDNNNILNGLSALLPDSANFLNIEMLKTLAMQYSFSTDYLNSEINLIKQILSKPENQDIKTLLQILHLLSEYKDAFETIFNLLKIAVTIPVSTASCERSFSCLKRVKTYLRTTMGNSRLSDMAIIAIEKERATNINLNKVIDVFASSHANRRIVLK